MASYIKFELEDGTFVFVESTDLPRGSSGFPLSGKGDHPTEQAAVSFENSIMAIRKMAVALIQEMRSGFTQTPDEMQVNFGLKASGEVGNLVVARGGMEANYNIMLRWSSREHDKQDESKAEEPAEEKPEAEKAAPEKAE